jgi:hypothetical protein
MLSFGLQDDYASIGEGVDAFEGVPNLDEEGQIHGIEVLGAGDGHTDDFAVVELLELEGLQ